MAMEVNNKRATAEHLIVNERQVRDWCKQQYELQGTRKSAEALWRKGQPKHVDMETDEMDEMDKSKALL